MGIIIISVISFVLCEGHTMFSSFSFEDFAGSFLIGMFAVAIVKRKYGSRKKSLIVGGAVFIIALIVRYVMLM